MRPRSIVVPFALLFACACSGKTPSSADAGTPSALDGSTGPAHDASSADASSSPDAAGPACLLSSDCASSGATFCEKDSCDPSVVGTCQVIPGTRETGYCSPTTDLVCGCDGQTYDYPCLAHAASVNIASQGPCALPEGGAGCSSNTDCGSGLYCKKDSCSAATGTCAGEPDLLVCFAEADGGQSTCGCDHQTYDNDCEAASYGVNVASEGACPPLPSGPCMSQSDCGDASYEPLVYCMPTTCGAAAGLCTTVPGACPALEDPVCGCDGNTYGNSCEAEQARVGWYVTDGGCP